MPRRFRQGPKHEHDGRRRSPMSTRARDPRASSCHRIVRQAIKNGDLVRPDRCSKCGHAPGLSKAGSPMIHGHHDDYSKPLDVQWLCPKCHREVTPLPAVMGAPTPGSRNGQAKMHESQIKALRENPLGAVRQSRIYGVSVTTIKDISSGRYWSHVK